MGPGYDDREPAQSPQSPLPQVCLHYLGSSSRVRQVHPGSIRLRALEVASAMEPHPVIAYRSLPS